LSEHFAILLGESINFLLSPQVMSSDLKSLRNSAPWWLTRRRRRDATTVGPAGATSWTEWMPSMTFSDVGWPGYIFG